MYSLVFLMFIIFLSSVLSWLYKKQNFSGNKEVPSKFYDRYYQQKTKKHLQKKYKLSPVGARIGLSHGFGSGY
jgi:hypothetical protein